ncbi:peroxisome assembly protein 12 isoform X2 [Orussus abietinus]|uniref:peroxisome assembly protein 12 isoform X2 n=1 Tax=Orussus abietinus TaxID=222816 RepID=UPI0006261181|nr:peroxisome assembly protein 12 isoform X2 [Orussus abietinus]
MAVKGAHLTGTTYAKPSIFEIVAQESLATTLQPALKKVISFLLTCNPERYGWLLRWSDEIYLVLHAVLQNYYLKNYSASFSETFYGLKRINLTNSKIQKKLSERQERLTLILLVLFPYLWEKISYLVNKYRLNAESEASNKGVRSSFTRCIIRGYTIGHVTYQTLVLYYYILYIAGRSSSPTPLLRLASLTLTYSEPHKVATISDLLRKVKEGQFSIDDSIDVLKRTVTRSLELGAFFLQFMQWWNQENYFTNLTALPAPPPPASQQKNIQDYAQSVVKHAAYLLYSLCQDIYFVTSAFCLRCRKKENVL